MKINVGCGKKFESEYFNIDFYEDLIADKIMSAINLEFEDNSCEEIKAIQIIEHLTYFEAIYALNEFFRVLQPKGNLIIEIPDLAKACQSFLNSNNEQKKQVLGWIYGVPDKGLQHKFCFPPYLLTEILENIGFINIETQNFFNHELIPIVRFECNKPEDIKNIEVFQIIAIIHKILQSDNLIDFNNSILVREQEDLLLIFLTELLEFQKRKRKEIIINILIEFLIKWPPLVKILLNVLKDKNILSEMEIKHIQNATDFLIQLDFPNILCNSIKKAPINPGIQGLVFNSVEIFAKNIILKLIFNSEEREKIINKLRILSEQINYSEIDFFSPKILERKSLDYFYLGIKAFHKENYKLAFKKLLEAIKLNRNDFLIFWNLSKLLVKLNRKNEAIKYYKKTLRLARITKIDKNQIIRKEIKKELNWLRKNGEVSQRIKPIMSTANFN